MQIESRITQDGLDLKNIYHNTTTTMRSSPSSTPMISVLDQVKLLHKLQAIQFQAHDRRGCPVLTLVGKLFPTAGTADGLVSREGVSKYLEDNIFPKLLGERAWSVVYIHTGVQRGDNFLGLWPLKALDDAMPLHIKRNLQALYFLHPDLPARLFFAASGRFLFGAGLYQKVKYVDRVEFLWEHVRRKEMEIPDFVHDHDRELEYRPKLHFDVDGDPPLYYASPFMQTSLPFYSMSFIA